MLYIDVDLFILVGITKRQNIIYYFCENKQDYCHKEKTKQNKKTANTQGIPEPDYLDTEI